ncbi:MAG: hypothetical protein KBB86_02460 [Candidatus Pacebacteria bacterium]|nr:hypothetical protein [Candidatus Paceibacterota bacterium]
MEKIKLTTENINQYPNLQELLDDGKVRFDKNGTLRYLHGAPVGKLIPIEEKDGTVTYKESAEEWFDIDSEKARDFVWE